MLPTSKDTCHPRKRMLLPGTAKTLTSPDIKMLHYSATQCNEIYSEYDVNVAYIFQLTFPQRTYFYCHQGLYFIHFISFSQFLQFVLKTHVLWCHVMTFFEKSVEVFFNMHRKYDPYFVAHLLLRVSGLIWRQHDKGLSV